jgi:hypothetical protein
MIININDDMFLESKDIIALQIAEKIIPAEENTANIPLFYMGTKISLRNKKEIVYNERSCPQEMYDKVIMKYRENINNLIVKINEANK